MDRAKRLDGADGSETPSSYAAQPSSSAPLSSTAPAYFSSRATLPSAASDRGSQAPNAATAYPRFPYASAADRGSQAPMSGAAAAYLHRAAFDPEMLFDRTTPSSQPGSEQMYGAAPNAPMSGAAAAYLHRAASDPEMLFDRTTPSRQPGSEQMYGAAPHAPMSGAAAGYLHRAASDPEMLFDRTTPSRQPGSEQMYGAAPHAPMSGAAAGYLHRAASDPEMLFDRMMPSRQPGSEQMYRAAPNAPTLGAAAGYLHPAASDFDMRPRASRSQYMQAAPTAANYHAPPYAVAPVNRTGYTHPSPYAATAPSWASISTDYPSSYAAATTSWVPNSTDYPSSYAASPSSWMTRPHATAYNASARPVTDLDARTTRPTAYPRAAHSTFSRPALPGPGLPRIDRVADHQRSQLLSLPLQLHQFLDTSKHHILGLLNEGILEFRQKVLATVITDVHKIMVHPHGCEVFQALVRGCTGWREELRSLVLAIAGRNHHRSDPSWRCTYGDDKNWVASMKITVGAVLPYPEMCDVLVECFCRDDLSVFKRRDGDELLKYCFDKLSYEQMQPLILHALAGAEDTILSSKSLAVCFDNARGEEMSLFEELLISRCTDMATGTFSNYFLQHAIALGGRELRKGIVERLMTQDVVALSSHKHGRHVVEECLKTHDVELLGTVLAAFCGLTDRQLVDMVRGWPSKIVLQMLLDTGYMHLPELRLTRELAQRLTMLPGDILSRAEAGVVATSVRRILYSH